MDSVTPSYVENVVAEGVPGRSPGGWKVDFSAQKGGVSQAEQTGSRLGADWEQTGSRDILAPKWKFWGEGWMVFWSIRRLKKHLSRCLGQRFDQNSAYEAVRKAVFRF